MKKGKGIFLFLFFLLGCADNYGEIMKKGIEFLENGESDKAIEEFKKIANEKNCEPHYGIFLAELQGIFWNINEINSKLKSFIPQEYGDILEVFLRESLSPIEKRLSEMAISYEQMERKGFCEIGLTLPIYLEIGNTIKANITFGERFGELEARGIGFLGYSVLSFLDLIFSHDLKANALSLFKGFLSMDTSSIVGIFRSLGFLFNDNPNFLNWNPDENERKRFESVPKEVSSGLRALHGMLSLISQRSMKKGYVVEYEDINSNNIVDATDKITLNVGGNLEVRGYKEEIKPYSASIPIWIQEDMLQQADEFLGKLSRGFNGEGTPGELYHLNELNGFLLAFGLDQIQDIVAIDPLAFFLGPFDKVKKSYPNPPSPKPLRKIAPYWYYDRFEEKVVLAVEGEVKESLGLYTYYLSSGDVPHFPPEHIKFENQDVFIFLLPDCVEVPNYQPDYVTLFYIAFQDPTFNGSVFVKLTYIKNQICDSTPKPYYDDFAPPDLYAVNKVFAFLFMKYGRLLLH